MIFHGAEQTRQSYLTVLKDPPDGGRGGAGDPAGERHVKAEFTLDVLLADVNQGLAGKVLGGQLTPRSTLQVLRLGAERQRRVEIGL